MQLHPLLFQPNLHKIVWGGNQLRSYKGLDPSDEPKGESWEVSAVPTSTSIVGNSIYTGKDLITVISENPDAILGKTVNEKYNGKLPLLVKFIDAKRDLSIQVDPNDDMTCANMVKWANLRCGMSSKLKKVHTSMWDSIRK